MLSHNTLIYLIKTQDWINEQEGKFPEIIIEQDEIREGKILKINNQAGR